MPDVVDYPSSVEPNPLADSGQLADAPVTEEVAAPPPSAPALTLEQVQQAIAAAMADTRKVLDRSLQSQLDKRDAGLRKQIDALRSQATQFEATAKASGIEEAQAKQLGQAFFNQQLNDLMAEEQAAANPAAGKPGARAAADEAPDDTQQVAAYQQYVTQHGDQLREAYSLDYTDPEMKTIVTDRDEQAYFDSIKAAGKAKQARLAKQGRTGSPARAPGLGTDGGSAAHNPIEKITDPDELYERAERRMREGQRKY